jgi:glycosyltransferase involved in cell wall biosynthesis
VTAVSVCIPVMGDPSGLEETLRSIRASATPEVEVVVAVDGPDAVLEELAAAHGAIAVVLPENRGPASARNAAIAATTGGVVCFVDAGCTVDPHWAEAHTRALAGADLSGGDVRFALGDRPTPAGFVDSQRHLRQRVYVERDGYAATCNLAVRRQVLDQVGFAEHFRLPGGEDVDFCHRATAAGFRLVFTEDAIVDHPPRSTAKELLSKVRRITKTMPDQAERWRTRELPPLRFSIRPWRVARRRYRIGPIWGLRASALDFAANWMIHRAAAEIRRTPPGP